MKISKNILLLALAAMVLSGCGSFLDEESQSEVIPKSASDFAELLMGNGYPDNNGPDFSWISYLDDDCDAYLEATGYDENWNPIDGFAGNSQSIYPLPYYSWQPYMFDLDGYGSPNGATASQTTYGQFYSKIMGCNAVLDNIDDAVGDAATRDRTKAEALALRAFMYWHLVNLYGEPYTVNQDAPAVPLKLTADLGTEGISRATVGEVYDNVIVPDLQKAAELMDPLEFKKKDYRINQPSIHIILSRVFLHMGRYQDCVDEATKAMGYGVRLWNMPAVDPATTDCSNCLNYDDPEVLWIFGPGVRSVSATNYLHGHGADFQAIWDSENDARYAIFGAGITSSYDVLHKAYGNSGLCQNIRMAEAYLNRMEAEALLGQEGAANNDLNTFCKSRYRNYTDVSLSGDELLKTIRLERRREFCYEGFRWFDLRRQGMPEIRHRYRSTVGGPVEYYVLKHNDPMYTLPLPNVLFDSNTQLTQNDSRSSAERVSTVGE